MNVVIITTVNTVECLYKIKEYCPGWVPIVAGDLKTPHERNKQICSEVGGIYLDPRTQMKLGFTHAAAVPWNCYARKNIAYLYALKEGAQLFYITDDDNSPLNDWSDHVDFSPKDYEVVTSDTGWYNCYEGSFTNGAGAITPRGYPWWLIGNQNGYRRKKASAKVGVIAGLPLGSPDVDAVTRMIKNPEVQQYPATDVVLEKGTMCPYDTQNTIIVRELIPANMLWSYSVIEENGKGWRRFDDIIAGYIGQVIAWKYGYRVRFGRPFCYQQRNPHDTLQDLLVEIDGMQYQKQMLDLISNIELTGNSVAEDLRIFVYAMLEAIPTLPKSLKVYVDTWIDDLHSIGMC